jgi:hypothetical protein
MQIDVALRGLFEAEAKLRTTEGVSNPVYASTHMMRLAQYAGAVEEKLAEIERDFEIETAVQLKERMIDRKMKVTQAEREVDIILASEKGQIKYLTRIVGSAWKQVGVIQSRINHLTKEATTQI